VADKKRTRLRDFQVALAERLQQATRQPERRSRLAVSVGDRRLLCSLDEVAEVAPVPAVTRVAKTQPWFLGVANVRGTLYAVTDLSRWLGGVATRQDAEARLVILGGDLARHRTALVVGRVLGLRQLEGMEPVSGGLESWATGAWRGADGVLWTELNFHQLLGEPGFLQVAA